MGKTLTGILAVLTSAIPSQVNAGVCETGAKIAAFGGGLVASASSVASMAGYAAVAHSSGAVILSSVGVGGTGYIGMGMAATGLAVVSSPIVIGGAAVFATGAAAVAGVCYANRKGLVG